MSVEDRAHMIEWLCIWTSYSSLYWEKQNTEFIELNYKQYLSDSAL